MVQPLSILFVENVVFEDIKVLIPWVFETLCKNFCTKVSIEVNDDNLIIIASLRDIIAGLCLRSLVR